MKWGDIRPGNEDDVRAYLADPERRRSISGEAYGMLALLLGPGGFDVVHRLTQELSVEVTGPDHT